MLSGIIIGIIYGMAAMGFMYNNWYLNIANNRNAGVGDWFKAIIYGALWPVLVVYIVVMLPYYYAQETFKEKP